MTVEYKVFSAGTAEELEVEVVNASARGWKVQGGLAVGRTDREGRGVRFIECSYHQAMTRTEAGRQLDALIAKDQEKKEIR